MGGGKNHETKEEVGNDIKEWTGMDFNSTTRAADGRSGWERIYTKSVLPLPVLPVVDTNVSLSDFLRRISILSFRRTYLVARSFKLIKVISPMIVQATFKRVEGGCFKYSFWQTIELQFAR